MILLLAMGCGPGTLYLDGEEFALSSAWFFSNLNESGPSILLSTGRLPCDLNSPQSPTQALIDSQAIQHATTREGSRLLWIEQPSPLTEGSQESPVALFEVHESERLWQEGLLTAYRVTDSTFREFSGILDVHHAEKDNLQATLHSTNSPSLKVRFSAKHCPFDETIQILSANGVE